MTSLMLVLVTLYSHQVSALSGGVLYPYGDSVQDINPPDKTLNRYAINFREEIKIMGRKTSQIKVSTRGEVKYQNVIFKLFGNPAQTFDLAANSQSQMYYRMTTDADFLLQLTDEINRVFGDFYIFRARQAAVVTWTDVTMQGGNDYTPVNSMQAVVVADVTQTFLIVNYEKINWFGSDDISSVSVKSFGVVETLGYGTRVLFSLPGGGSHLPTHLKEGNSRTPFRWMFRIDLCETCLGLPRGVCLASSHLDDRTQCFCDSKYRGSLCETDIAATNECLSSPCQRGQCVDRYDSYICQCPSGYQGVQCEIPIDPGSSGTWSAWSDCSKTCDYGIHTRIRQCLAMPCSEPNTQTEVCQLTPCEKYPVDDRYTLLLVGAKPMLQMLRDEPRIKETIASVVNSYCTNNTYTCCEILSDDTPSQFKEYLTVDDVISVAGYPKFTDEGQILIRVSVKTTTEALTAACNVNKRRRKRNSSADMDVYFTRNVMTAAVEQQQERFLDENGLCCYKLLPKNYSNSKNSTNSTNHVAFEASPPSLTLLLGVSIPLVLIIIALSALLILNYVKNKRVLQKKLYRRYNVNHITETERRRQGATPDEVSVDYNRNRGMVFQPSVRFNPIYTSK